MLQDFKCLKPETAFGAIAKAELDKVFADSPDYRFMYSLRNHVQHKATAIHGFEGNDDKNCDPNSWVETLKFFANRTILKADKDFKARVLDEQPEKIDVRRCARRSVQKLGVTHLSLRKVLEEHVVHARSTIEAVIHNYKEAGAESAIALCVRCVKKFNPDIPLLLDWDDVRLQLVNKNAYSPELWPSRTSCEPKTEEIFALREELQHTQAQAAEKVFVSEARWQDYEDGLPMPKSLFHLYRLQIGRHPTHRLQPLNAADRQEQPSQV